MKKIKAWLFDNYIWALIPLILIAFSIVFAYLISLEFGEKQEPKEIPIMAFTSKTVPYFECEATNTFKYPVELVSVCTYSSTHELFCICTLGVYPPTCEFYYEDDLIDVRLDTTLHSLTLNLAANDTDNPRIFEVYVKTEMGLLRYTIFQEKFTL